MKAIFAAIELDQNLTLEQVTKFIGKGDVNSRNERSETALMVAARKGLKQTVESLLQIDGIKLSLKNTEQKDVFEVAKQARQEEVLQLLCQYQMEKNLAMVRLTPEKYLAQIIQMGEISPKERSDLVTQALLGKADPNKQDEKGCTPLMYAADKNYLAVVDTLLKHPAINLKIVNKDGWNVQRVARDNEVLVAISDKIREMSEKVIQLISKKSRSSFRSLLFSSQVDNIPYGEVKDLLARGADPNVKNSAGKEGLIIAMEAKDEELAKIFLKAGADPIIKNKKGFSPMDLAYQNQQWGLFNDILRKSFQSPSTRYTAFAQDILRGNFDLQYFNEENLFYLSLHFASEELGKNSFAELEKRNALPPSEISALEKGMKDQKDMRELVKDQEERAPSPLTFPKFQVPFRLVDFDKGNEGKGI